MGALRYGAVLCTHPDHVAGTSCADRAVACHPDCVCCRPEAAAMERDLARAEVEQLRGAIDALVAGDIRVKPTSAAKLLYCGQFGRDCHGVVRQYRLYCPTAVGAAIAAYESIHVD